MAERSLNLSGRAAGLAIPRQCRREHRRPARFAEGRTSAKGHLIPRGQATKREMKLPKVAYQAFPIVNCIVVESSSRRPGSAAQTSFSSRSSFYQNRPDRRCIRFRMAQSPQISQYDPRNIARATGAKHICQAQVECSQADASTQVLPLPSKGVL